MGHRATLHKRLPVRRCRPRESQVKRCRWPSYALDSNSSASNHRILLQQQIQSYICKHVIESITWLWYHHGGQKHEFARLLPPLHPVHWQPFAVSSHSLQSPGREMGISIFISIFILNILDCALLMILLSMGQSANAPSAFMCSSLDQAFQP